MRDNQFAVFNAAGLRAAVEQCLEVVGDDPSKVTRDIIMLDNFSPPALKTTAGNSATNFFRGYELRKHYQQMENVISTMMRYPSVNYRYLFLPSGWYPRLWNLLNFNYPNTWPMQENGMADAKTGLAKGPGAVFDIVREYIDRGKMSNRDVLDIVARLMEDAAN